MSKRWVILQHTLSKESLEGLHFDLLLEDGEFCRTWRLSSIPSVDCPSVEATPIAPHMLHWLEREESYVSGGRGWAKRVLAGNFDGSLPVNNFDSVSIEIHSASFNGRLKLHKKCCHISFSF